ncbi:hypothetical protein MPER_05008, partial [Moniliophthora perniciosa FA553]
LACAASSEDFLKKHGKWDGKGKKAKGVKDNKAKGLNNDGDVENEVRTAQSKGKARASEAGELHKERHFEEDEAGEDDNGDNDGDDDDGDDDDQEDQDDNHNNNDFQRNVHT